MYFGRMKVVVQNERFGFVDGAPIVIPATASPVVGGRL
jgi:hypothetical protein